MTAKVFTGASMSLDGYISGPGDTGFEQLFAWYGNGDVEVPTAQPEMTLRMTPASAEYFRSCTGATGAIVVGRRQFDFTGGWGGNHPMGKPVVVVTHRVPDGWPREGTAFTFVTDGVERAVEQAKALAGDARAVGVSAGAVGTQCLDAGLLDEVRIDLVPVLLGGGTPFFDRPRDAPFRLEGPVTVVEAKGVTHLRYRVPRQGPDRATTGTRLPSA